MVKPTTARGIAFAALREWRATKKFSDSLIGKFLSPSKLSGRDRAFALELFYGVLRNMTLLDFWIRCLRSGRLDLDLRDAARLGLYQLFVADTTEHAAVHETVGLLPKSRRGVVNAILRNAIRRREELLQKAKTLPLWIRKSHPEFLVRRWEQNFGPENTEALCLRNNEPPLIYGRINQLKIGRDDFFRTYFEASPVSSYPQFVEFNGLPEKAIALGHCYIQDPSTSLACQILDPKPGEKILDACAAPGGKTTYLAELMNNKGVIIACDRDATRLSMLRENSARLGATIITAVKCDWERDTIPAKIRALAPFDRILVDAPCSNTGVMRRRVDVRWRLKPDDFIQMPKQQMSILRAVIPLLRETGLLVYSTCSLEAEENEEIAKQLVMQFPQLELVDERRILPFRDSFDGAYSISMVKA